MGGADVCTPGLLALTAPLQKFPRVLRPRGWRFKWGWWGHLGTLGHFCFSGFQSSLHRAGDGRHGLAGEDAGAP